MAIPSGKAIDAAYLLTQLKHFDSQVSAIKYNEKFQVEEMPIPSDKNIGKIVQYIGNTTSLYTNGYFYKGVEVTDEQGVSYKWQAVTQEGTGGNYTIKKAEVAVGDAAVSYNLYNGDEKVGDTINVPKDMVVSDGKVEFFSEEGGYVDSHGNPVTFETVDTLEDRTNHNLIYFVLEDNKYYKWNTSLLDWVETTVVETKAFPEDFPEGYGAGWYIVLTISNSEQEHLYIPTNGLTVEFETINIDFYKEW